MIVVYTPDGDRFLCSGANRFKTDEHNNLEVLSGTESQPAYVACFRDWERVVVEEVPGGEDAD